MDQHLLEVTNKAFGNTVAIMGVVSVLISAVDDPEAKERLEDILDHLEEGSAEAAHALPGYEEGLEQGLKLFRAALRGTSAEPAQVIHQV